MNNKRQRAVRLDAASGLEAVHLDAIERPVPGDGEVVVAVRAAGVNPVDWKIAEGAAAYFGLELPATLGCELSGVVVEAQDDSGRLSPGDEVFGYVSLERCGAFADYALALPEELAAKPAGLTHTEAAALPVAGETSWQALFDTAGLTDGQRVLIHAASGGVGSVGVQLAKARGAYVIGTASAANERFVRALGVDEFIDYRSTRFEAVVSDVDVVYDTVGGETQQRSYAVLKRGGRLVSIVEEPDPETAAGHGVRAEMIGVKPNGAELARIGDLVVASKLRPEIARVYALEDAPAALAESRRGHVRGKLVLEL